MPDSSISDATADPSSAAEESSPAFVPGMGPGASFSVPHAETGRLAGRRVAVKALYSIEQLPNGPGADVPGYLSDDMPSGPGEDEGGTSTAAAESGLAAVGPHMATETALAVETVLGEGARFVGRSVAPELVPVGDVPVSNHADPDRTIGLACGGCSAVARGEADIAVVTDTDGGIRVPAALGGLVGLRTTVDRAPVHGLVSLAPSFDTVGWFAATYDDYVTMAEVSLDGPSALERERPAPRPMRCAALDALVVPAARDAYERAAERICDLLAPDTAVDGLELGLEPDDLAHVYAVLVSAEVRDMHGQGLPLGDGDHPAPREAAPFVPAAPSTDHERRLAHRDRDGLRAWLSDELDRDGILVLPTVPSAAPRRDADEAEHIAFRRGAAQLLSVSGLSGMPQLSLPLLDMDGAPFGVSILGPRGSDRHLLRLGRSLMDALGISQRVRTH